jgi:hypothetical protein
VPNARKQGYDGAGFDTMALGGHLRFKHTLALSDVYELIGGKDAPFLPIKMMVDGVTPGWVGTSRLHPFIAHRSGGAFPRILLLGGDPEINIIAFHQTLVAIGWGEQKRTIAPSICI